MATEPRFESALQLLLDGQPLDLLDEAQEAPLRVLSLLEALSCLTSQRPEASHWGPYRLLDEVGRGAMGTVWRAWDSRLARVCAVKLLDRDLASQDAVMLEAQAMASIAHPGVLTVYGTESHNGQHGLCMEYVDGAPLDAIIERDGPFAVHEVLLIARAVCAAVAAVHQQGLLHGDIKARNVLRERGGRIVLADFGAASARGDMLPLRQGTRLYMSPELRAGAPPAVASDVYAVGVLCLYLLTGRHSLVSLESEAEGVPHVPPDVRGVLARLVAPEAADRPATALEAAATLDALLRSRLPDLADLRTHGLTRRWQSWPRWPRRAATLACALAALGLSGSWDSTGARAVRRAAGWKVGPKSTLVLTLNGGVAYIRGRTARLESGNPYVGALTATSGDTVYTATSPPGLVAGGIRSSARTGMVAVADEVVMCCFRDATSDGRHFYAVRRDSTLTSAIGSRPLAPATLMRFGQDWSTPEAVFKLSDTPDYSGLAFVATLDAFVVTKPRPGSTRVELWSREGALVGHIATIAGPELASAAYDPEDDSLWLAPADITGMSVGLVNVSLDGRTLERLEVPLPVSTLGPLGLEALRTP